MPERRIADLFKIGNRFLRSAHLERDFQNPSVLSAVGKQNPQFVAPRSKRESGAQIDTKGFPEVQIHLAGAAPNSGVLFNSLSIDTNWAYVTGGAQFTSFESVTTNIAIGQTLILNLTALEGGGVTATYTWQTNNGVSSGP